MEWDEEDELDADDDYSLSNADARWVRGLRRSVTLFFWAMILNTVCLGILFSITALRDRLDRETTEISEQIERATVKLPAGPVGNGSIRVETFDENGNRVVYNIDTKASDDEALADVDDDLGAVVAGMKRLLMGLCLLAPVILLMGVLLTWSVFLLTAREPGQAGSDGLERWRVAMRLAPFAIIPLVVLKPFLGNLEFILNLCGTIIGVVLFTGQSVFLRRYAYRLPDYQLAESTKKITDWLTQIPLGVLVVLFLASFIVGPFLQNNMTIIVSVLLAIWGGLFIRYLCLLWQYRTAFRNAIREK